MIEPIKLLAGSHKDTASTGQGCFMNVIAYLNGEAQITDKSECVCFVMRPLAIYANDLFNDEDRQRLLPFILRAIGSRTDDKEVITERLRHVVAFAEKQSKYAAKSAEYAEYAAKWYKTTRDDLLTMFDACFPQLTKPQAVHLERAKRLHEMASA